MYTSASLKKIHDEIKALKVVQPINGGALTKHPVSASITATIDKSTPISKYSMLAAFEATFTRTDGENKTPLTQFSYLLEPDVFPSYEGSYDAVIGATNNSISYKIILKDDWWPFGANQTGTVKITVYALSMVEGTLNIARVYS